MRKTTGLLLGGMAIGLFSASGRATVLFDSGGFESSSGYAPGSLYNQPTSAPIWGYATGGNNSDTAVSAVTVENSVAYSGTQAVQFARATTDADTYYYPFTYVSSPYTVSQRYLDIAWSMNVQSTVTNDPFFGIYGFNGGNSLAFGGVAVDNGTGYVISSGNGGYYNASNTVPLNQWNNFVLQLDYNPTNTSMQTETLYVNGVATSSGSFISTGQTQFTDADITSVDGTYDGSGDEIASAGTAYFDNYQVYTSSTAVPEPTAGTMLLIGSAVAMLRRRRSNTSTEI